MPQVHLTRIVEAPVFAVWDAWDDYMNIDRYNPNISRSFAIGDGADTGLGATRQCDLIDGKNYIQERIVDYVPQSHMGIDIFNGTMPLKSARADIRMRDLGQGRTELTFTMTFVPKMGILGRLMVPMMKSQFSKLLGELVDANKVFVETGREVARG
ncbi:MAG: SRPBCC family protein [Pseudomonadota bacterium]